MKPFPLPRSGGTYRCENGVLVREDGPVTEQAADVVDSADRIVEPEAPADALANPAPPSAARPIAAPSPAKKPNRAVAARKR